MTDFINCSNEMALATIADPTSAASALGKSLLADGIIYTSDGVNWDATSVKGLVDTLDVRLCGAKCDAVRTFGGGVTSAGSKIFSDLSANFKAEDFGKLIYIAGAGNNGTCLISTISLVQSSTVISISDAASISISSAHYIYGSDDTTAWQRAYDSVGDGKTCTITMPYGLSLTDQIPLRTNIRIKGQNADGWAFRNSRRASGILIKPTSKTRGGLYAINGSVGNVNLSDFFVDGAFRFKTNAISRYSGATTTAGSNTITFTNGTFQSSDIGKTIAVFGAGVGGALQEGSYIGEITGVTDANTITVLDANNPATKSVSNAAYAYGFYDGYGNDGVTTSGIKTFSAASASFTQSDIGKAIDLFDVMAPTWGDGTTNHGDGKGEFLACHIVSVESPTSITLSTAPELTLTGVKWRFGYNNGVYMQEAPLSQDSMWDIGKLNLLYMSGHGYVMGNWQRAQRINNLNGWQVLGHGMVMLSSDNSVDQSMMAYCGMDGWYVNQSTNRFVNIDSFNNEGNGAYFGGYGSMCTLIGASLDYNGKNGCAAFAKGTRFGVGTRFTSNSQKKHGGYSDLTVCRKVVGGPTNLNKAGCTYNGVFHEKSTGANTNRPAWLVDNVGPYGIRGEGVQYDPDVSSGMWVTGPTTSGTVFSLTQSSTSFEAGNSITFRDNNTVNCLGGGTKFGGAVTDKISFYGATPIVKPTVSGAKGSNAALASLLTKLASLGIIIDTTTA